MKFTPLDLEGLILLEPSVYRDERGYFCETFRLNEWEEHFKDVHFVQENQSLSKKGALRGFHFQKGEWAQAKLVRVTLGSVYDVVVDIRPNSPSFGRSFAIQLDDQNLRMLFIPRGFAHGFLTLSEQAIFQYKTDNYYSKDHEAGIRFNDPSLQIDWPMPENSLVVSPKDLQLPFLKDLSGIDR